MINTRLAGALALAAAVGAGNHTLVRAQADGVTQLLRQVEQVVPQSTSSAYAALLTESADRDLSERFVEAELPTGLTRLVIQERAREPLIGTLPGDGYRLLVDAFTQAGNRARVATWQLDVRRTGSDPGSSWRIDDQRRIAAVENLYKLSLDATKQFTARNLKINVDDLDLVLPDGTAFVAEADAGVTAIVLMGRGEMNFHPTPETEKGQLKIFAGTETLQTAFDAVYLRINPADFETLVSRDQLTETPVDARAFRRAEDIFREESAKSYVVELGDLSRDTWSVLPASTDMLAEIRTRRYDTLSYAHASGEAEDINLFDRKRRRNIALYPSARKVAERGPTFDEADLSELEVLDYDIDLAVQPERRSLEGRAVISLRVRANSINTITLRLASSLNVQSIVSDEFGWLYGLRVKNQNSLVVNLPATVLRDEELSLTVTYSGVLDPEMPDRETVAQQRRSQDETLPEPTFVAEPSLVYSTGSFWYPQPAASNYSTAALRITVPAAYGCVASGSLVQGSPTLLPAGDASQARKVYVFAATQPVRYLSFVVSRFVVAQTMTIDVPPGSGPTDEQAPTGTFYRQLDLTVMANPRQVGSGRDIAPRAADIVRFYQSLIDDLPYPTFTLAVVENELPGGHSPGYFAVLNQPLPTTIYTWRNDPAAFGGFPDFFLAHEIAHQWWGQAVGWRNYHEQWLSEGFAQYFSALYAQHQRGDDVFGGVMRQMRRWAIDESSQGPVSLGYRLGHIRGESRVFRALVYNKGAAVLHMLRRLVGDDAFFRGLRRFYRASRFRKVGTEEFRAAMELETGRSLDRFFARWIYGSTLPRVKFSYRVDGADLVLHAEQVGDIFDLPLTVTVQYVNRKAVDVPLLLTDRTADVRVQLAGMLRSVDVSKDDGAIAEVVKN